MTAFHRARIEPNRVYRPRCPHCGALGDRRFVVDQDGMLEDILSVGLRFDAVTTCSSCHFEGPMLPVPEGRRAAQTYASEADWRREVMSEARHALAGGDAARAWEILNEHEGDGYPWWPDRGPVPNASCG